VVENAAYFDTFALPFGVPIFFTKPLIWFVVNCQGPKVPKQQLFLA
jgi:hypothetical protein